MKVILIEGDKGAGKTTMCLAIEKWIIEKWSEKGCLKIIREPNCGNHNDFFGVYEKQKKSQNDKNNKELPKYNQEKKVIINSASDNYKAIEEFEKFYKKHHKDCDILISAIRPTTINPDLHKRIEQIFDGDLGGNKPFVINLEKTNGTFSLSDFIKDIV